PVDEVPARVADESVADKVFAVGVAAVDGEAGRSREITAGAPAAFHGAGHKAGHAPLGAEHAPRLVEADAEDFSRRAVGGDAHARAGHGVIGIPRGVAILIDD